MNYNGNINYDAYMNYDGNPIRVDGGEGGHIIYLNEAEKIREREENEELAILIAYL
jgi:hypothetical protein